ncbi:hypothetical protein ABK040_010274 [Willaertia magna]
MSKRLREKLELLLKKKIKIKKLSHKKTNSNNEDDKILDSSNNYDIEYNELVKELIDIKELNELQLVNLKEEELNVEEKQFLTKMQNQIQKYSCPISNDLMTIPVILESGKSFQKENIEEWLKINNTCPITRKKIKSSFTVNYDLKSIIDDFINIKFLPKMLIYLNKWLDEKRALNCCKEWIDRCLGYEILKFNFELKCLKFKLNLIYFKITKKFEDLENLFILLKELNNEKVIIENLIEIRMCFFIFKKYNKKVLNQLQLEKLQEILIWIIISILEINLKLNSNEIIKDLKIVISNLSYLDALPKEEQNTITFILDTIRDLKINKKEILFYLFFNSNKIFKNYVLQNKKDFIISTIEWIISLQNIYQNISRNESNNYITILKECLQNIDLSTLNFDFLEQLQSFFEESNLIDIFNEENTTCCFLLSQQEEKEEHCKDDEFYLFNNFKNTKYLKKLTIEKLKLLLNKFIKQNNFEKSFQIYHILTKKEILSPSNCNYLTATTMIDNPLIQLLIKSNITKELQINKVLNDLKQLKKETNNLKLNSILSNICIQSNDSLLLSDLQKQWEDCHFQNIKTYRQLSIDNEFILNENNNLNFQSEIFKLFGFEWKVLFNHNNNSTKGKLLLRLENMFNEETKKLASQVHVQLFFVNLKYEFKSFTTLDIKYDKVANFGVSVKKKYYNSTRSNNREFIVGIKLINVSYAPWQSLWNNDFQKEITIETKLHESQIKNGMSFYSENFEVFGFIWKIRFYPKGKTGKEMSIYLTLMSSRSGDTDYEYTTKLIKVYFFVADMNFSLESRRLLTLEYEGAVSLGTSRLDVRCFKPVSHGVYKMNIGLRLINVEELYEREM